MRKKISLLLTIPFVVSAAIFLSGCKTETAASSAAPAAKENPAAATAPAESVAPATPQTPQPPELTLANGAYRVKAGRDTAYTDSEGHVWQQDQGFSGGDIIERDADTKITGTKDPDMFMTEHYSMDSFACRIPNGNYTANLYFAETYDGIGGPGDRVFSFNVQGHEFKDFDVWVKAGGHYRPYVETVPVTVTNGVFRIDFTTQTENPEINAIELIPAS